MNFLIAFIATIIGCSILVPLLLGVTRLFGVYTIVNEGTCKVYMLFGKVLTVLNEPGLHFLLGTLGPRAFIVNILGKCYELDLRLDQTYLRSQPVNSEEGAPMGIGIWYEMNISDATNYLFKNADPRGSLAANVSNSTVRCLSNLPLDRMLQDRHTMSQTVREEVWGDITSPPRWVRMPQFEHLVDRRFRFNYGYQNESIPSFLQRTWVCAKKIEIHGLKDEEIVKIGDRRFILPDSQLAVFLLSVHAVAKNLTQAQKNNLFQLVKTFEESINDRDGIRTMKRFYEDEAHELSTMLPLKLCLDALKSTKAKVFDTSAWSRKTDDND